RRDPGRCEAGDVAAPPADAPRLWAVEAADDVEDARLARAVGAYERRHLTLLEAEADTGERGQAPEGEGDGVELEERGHPADRRGGGRGWPAAAASPPTASTSRR